MNKRGLVEAIVKNHKVSEPYAVRMVTIVVEEMFRALVSGVEVRLTGFGTLCSRVYKGGIRRNPQTGEPVHTDDRVGYRFIPAAALVDMANKKRPVPPRPEIAWKKLPKGALQNQEFNK